MVTLAENSPLSHAIAVATAVAGLAACTGDDDGPPSNRHGTVGGRVLVTLDGPLVGATVSVDQLDYYASTTTIRVHEGDTTTDMSGRFALDVGIDSGYFLVSARGGQFVDYATGETVVLDPANELRAILYTDVFEELTTGTVSPISHLTQALALSRLDSGEQPSIVEAHVFAVQHIDGHFGDLPWERVQPASLDMAQASPTDEVRAAFVLGAWSLLAQDVAAQASSSVQEVNAYTLAAELGRDLAAGQLDGNDGNNKAAGSGIQLGACPPIMNCTETGDCTLGSCRTVCDAYAGTLRALLSGEVTKLINDTDRNQTGLAIADTLSLAITINANTDPVLFGDTCIEELDRVAPTLRFEDPSPIANQWVRGAITLRAVATDNVPEPPTATWASDLSDQDGAPDVVLAFIDTLGEPDGSFEAIAEARDASGNSVRVTHRLNIDNLAPVVTIASSGFYVSGTDWWTATDAPVLSGSITEDNLAEISVQVDSIEIGTATVSGSDWTFQLPPGSIAGTVGSTVRLEAVDLAGNTAGVSQRIRFDGTPPMLTVLSR